MKRKYYAITITLIFFFLFFNIEVSAQTTEIRILEVNMEHSGTGTTGLDTFNVNLVLMLGDTVNTEHLHVTLSDTSGQQTFISHTFDFDSQSGLQAGYGYQRTGNMVELQCGKYWRLDQYKLSVRSENAQGVYGNTAIY